jgi:tRNA A-37 threonylcarbamoyl transferase component Bud32
LPGGALGELCPICLLQRVCDEASESESDDGSKAQPEPARGADQERPDAKARSQAWNDLCETVSYRASPSDRARRGAAPDDAGPAPAVALESFIQALFDARLMDRSEFESFLERFALESRPRQAEALARELIRARRLTEYQAGALLQGKWRGLAVGNYLVLDRLGKGGMGMVFKARHRRTKRIVALKLLPPSYARSESAVLRFQREAEAVGRLGHPNIVAALDAGDFNGLHYFVMEYVEGCDLARLVKEEGPLPLERALDYLGQAARGLKAAHDQGTFHRDIKPSNLMLDTAGTIKIVDLGLARIGPEMDVSGPADSDFELSSPGDILGTVSFMAPEQALDPSAADHRSDIYSLGCTLYWLLTGATPYSGATRLACLQAHREQPIPRLRDRLPAIAPIVDTMLERMLAKAPADRYESMAALLADLEACRAAKDQPLPAPAPPQAAGTTAEGRAGRRRLSIVLGVALIAALAALIISTRRDRPAPLLVKHDGVDAVRNGKPESPPSEDTKRPEERPPGDLPVGEPQKKELRPAEPVGEAGSFPGHGRDRVQSIAVATDEAGRAVALSAGNDRAVLYWEVATGRVIHKLPHEGPIFAVAFLDPDGRYAVSAGSDRLIHVWDLVTGGELGGLPGHEKSIYSLAVSPDGRRVLSGSGDHTVRLWDVESWKEIDQLKHKGAVTCVAFSPLGPRALSGSEDASVRLWDISSQPAREVHCLPAAAPVLCVAFAPDGHRALSGGEDGTLTLWDLDEGKAIRRFPGPRDYVRCVTFLPDGRRALSATQASRQLIVWDVESTQPVAHLEGPAGHRGVVVMADGLHALTADDDGVVRRWRLPERTVAGSAP